MHPLRHPRNTAFIWQQPKPPYELITSEQAIAYRECGGFILANAFSKKEIEQLLTALDPIEEEVNERLAGMPKDQHSIARADELVFSANVVPRSAIVKIRTTPHFCQTMSLLDRAARQTVLGSTGL